MSTMQYVEMKDLVRLVMLRGEESLALRREADALRQKVHGDAIHLRGLIEFSNVCRNRCLYCGIRGPNGGVHRFRIPAEEIVAAAYAIREAGCGTVVLQSGVDGGLRLEALVELVHRLHEECQLAITLSVGTLPREALAALREAGADRYLLRFETSNAALFEKIHPDETFARRVACLHDLRECGFQVGSGFMIGLPGWTPESLARDIRFATELKLDMIGCGPFRATPETPMADAPSMDDEEVCLNTLALLRLCNPRAHLPATTALDALRPGARANALASGCNVFMPNFTPARYREEYALYPGKPRVDDDGRAAVAQLRTQFAAMGRSIAVGPGHAVRT